MSDPIIRWLGTSHQQSQRKRMLLLIIGLHFILGSIWLINKNLPGLAFLCFIVGMAATHFGWKKMSSRDPDGPEMPDNSDSDLPENNT